MVSDIRQWLEELGLDKYGEVFVENEVNLQALPHITDNDLKELGVGLGARRQILAAAALLNADAALSPPDEATEIEQPLTREAERRQLTVMFCDLVGSTALSQQLDPEDLRDVIRRYQDAVAGAVARYDGHVAKFLGDGVLAYFGWPQAHEGEAERAVRTGLDAIDAVQRILLDNGAELQARVGIATGQVVVGDLIGDTARDDDAVIGETPNLAARLQGEADPGQMVIEAVTRNLIGAAFELEDLGERSLKGFSRPATVWRVSGEGAVGSRFEVAHAGSLTRLVGRENEVALLRERWDLAKEGEGQVVLLSGEAGIGKSRIVSAARELAGNEPHFRLRYQCSPFHINSAFYPITQRLERAARFEQEDSTATKLDKLETLLRPSASDLPATAQLFAALLSLPAEDRYGALELTPDQRRDFTFAALVEQIIALSRQRPVLFIMEDVHWIDPTTQNFVGEVMTQVADANVLMLVTHRPEFSPPWSGHSHLTSLALNRLSREQARKIVAAVGGADLPDTLVKNIVARADGIPLFVEELTKSVLEAGESEGGPVSVEAIPATLQASLTARLDRLDDAKSIAQIGAAIGREYSYDLIAAVSQESATHLEEALNRLIEAELVFRTATMRNIIYTFKHTLIQEVAYESMLKSRRSELHLQIAETLEATFPSIVETEPEVLARHYSMAGKVEPAIVYWRRAGELSTEASANLEAVSHFEKALELLVSLPASRSRDQQELELRIALGGPLLMTRGHGAPEVGNTYSRARELCQELSDSPQIVPALLGMWRYYIGRGNCTVTPDLGRQILELGRKSDDDPTTVLGHYGLGFALFCHGDLAQARGELETGYRLYDRKMRENLSFRLGQDPGVACMSYCALALWVLGYPDQAKRISDKALALAEDLSHPFSSAYALSLACQVSQHRGEINDVLEIARAALEISSAQGFAVWVASPTIFKGWAHAQQGDPQGGGREAYDAVNAIVEAGMEMRRPYYLALVAECEIKAGRIAEAKSIIEEALGVIDDAGEHWSEPELLRLSGEIAAIDAADTAETLFHQALSKSRSMQAKSWELRCATSLARFMSDNGEAETAKGILKPIYSWFTEGFDTPDLKEAKSLLDGMN